MCYFIFNISYIFMVWSLLYCSTSNWIWHVHLTVVSIYLTTLLLLQWSINAGSISFMVKLYPAPRRTTVYWIGWIVSMMQLRQGLLSVSRLHPSYLADSEFSFSIDRTHFLFVFAYPNCDDLYMLVTFWYSSVFIVVCSISYFSVSSLSQPAMLISTCSLFRLSQLQSFPSSALDYFLLSLLLCYLKLFSLRLISAMSTCLL